MNISNEQLTEWKAKNKEVYQINVEGRTCYVKKPSRQAIGYASMAGKDNPIKFTETLMQDCWLGGDEEIQRDDSLFLSVGAKLAELVEIKSAELVKL